MLRRALILSLIAMVLAFMSLPIVAFADLPEIQRAGVLKVGVTVHDRPPFYYNYDDSLRGAEVDMIKAYALSIGVKAEFVAKYKTHDDLVDGVWAMQVDAGWSKLNATPFRERLVNFSNPYWTTRHALLVRKDCPDTLGQTFTGPIAVIEKTSYVRHAKENFPQAIVIEVPDFQQTIEAVLNGTVAAAYRDEFEYLRIMQASDYVSSQAKVHILSNPSPVAVAVPKQSKKLLASINKFIEAYQPKMTTQSLLAIERQRFKTLAD